MRSRMCVCVVLTLALMLAAGCNDSPNGNVNMTPLPNPAGKLYVLNQTDSTIYIFDTKTFTRIDSFPAQVTQPHYICFSHDGLNYYVVTLEPNGRIAKYETATNTLVASVRTGGAILPSSIAIGGADKFGYVTDFTSSTNIGKVYKFDLGTMTVVDSFLSGSRSHDIKSTSDGRWVVACNHNSDDITVIDVPADTVTRISIDPDSAYPVRIDAKYGPLGVALDHRDSLAFLACAENDQIRVLDIAAGRIVDSMTIPHVDPVGGNYFGPTLMTVSPDNSVIYTTTQWSNRVVGVNLETHEIVGDLSFETPRSFGISVSDDGSRVYVACVNVPVTGIGRVYAIDTRTFTKVDSVDVGKNSMGLIYRGL